MSGNNKDTTALILAAMDDLGPADARTIAEKADVGYSTAVRKLRDWAANDEIIKIDRGADPAHYAMCDPAQALPTPLQPAPGDQPEPADINAGDLDAAADPDPPTDENGLPAKEGESDVVPEGATAQADADEAADEGDGGVASEEDDGASASADVAAGALDDDADPHRPDQAGDDVAVDGVIPADLPTPAELAAEPDALPDGDDSSEQQVADTAPDAATSVRRPKDYFRTAGMTILRAHPDTAYTVGDIAKLIVAKEIAAGAPASTKASSGAISNALHKAAAAGECLVVIEKPVTFQAA